MNALETVERITEAQVNTAERDDRVMKIGEVAHQGDVYVCRVERHADIYQYNRLLGEPKDRGPKTAERQVVRGVTIGSKHIVEGNVTIYAPPDDGSPLEGPTIAARSGWRLVHPEHATHRFSRGTFVVTFQREISEELRRVKD